MGIFPHPVSPSASTLINRKQISQGHLEKQRLRLPQTVVNRCDWPTELWTLKLHHTQTSSERCQRLQHTHSWRHCSDWLRPAEHLKLSNKWIMTMKEMILSCLGTKMFLWPLIPPKKGTVNMNDSQSYSTASLFSDSSSHSVHILCKALNWAL